MQTEKTPLQSSMFYKPPENIINKLQTKYKIDIGVISAFLTSFNNFDKNGDGVISITELGEVIKLITPHLSHSPTETEIQEMIKAVDKNQDNMIQFEEFVALVINKKESVLQNSIQLNVGRDTLSLPINGAGGFGGKIQTRSNSDSGISNQTGTGNVSDNVSESNLDIEQVFKIFDKNGDGFISKNEISDVMSQLGEPVTAEDISNMTLGKEHLNFDQFKQVITNFSQVSEPIKQEEPERTDNPVAGPPTSCTACNIM